MTVRPSLAATWFWSKISLANTGRYRPCGSLDIGSRQDASWGTHAVRLSGEMETTTLELAEGFEKHRDEGVDIFSSVFGGTDVLAVVCIRQPDTDAVHTI